MKKTCNGCRAQGLDGRCELGYKTEVKNNREFWGRLIIEWKPSEECPKPKTNDQLIRLERR